MFERYLTSIIIGARMHEDDIKIMRSWIQGRFSNIQLKKVELQEDGLLNVVKMV